ncbi:MAG: PxKF domain-containing protein [Thermoleophilaceae bacterium]|nr:PxKF domain-containing protein [Thermoleophilaceae bacterium]
MTVSYGSSTDPKLADGSDGSGVAGYTAAQTFSTSGSHAYSGKATDNAGNESASATGTVKVDATAPVVSLTCPSELKLGSTASASWTAQDAHSGLAGAAGGAVSLDTTAVGEKTASVPAGTAQDKVGHGSAAASCQYRVIYDFHGFFEPVNNPSWLNSMKAGQAVPVKFDLSGYQGMSIFAAGYPSSKPIACPSSAPPDTVEEAFDYAGQSSLSYDQTTQRYSFVWKTDKAWAGKCRQLMVRFSDGREYVANFQFTK